MLTALAFNPAPVLALSVVDLISQAVIAFIAVALYHAWQSGRQPVEPSRPAPAEPMAVAKPTAAVVATPVAASPVVAAAPPVPAPAPALAHAVAAVPAPAPKPAESLAPEIAAVIAAAVAAVLDRPHRVLAVQQAFMPTPHLNVWA